MRGQRSPRSTGKMPRLFLFIINLLGDIDGVFD
jgi:hypothetical protein